MRLTTARVSTSTTSTILAHPIKAYPLAKAMPPWAPHGSSRECNKAALWGRISIHLPYVDPTASIQSNPDTVRRIPPRSAPWDPSPTGGSCGYTTVGNLALRWTSKVSASKVIISAGRFAGHPEISWIGWRRQVAAGA